VGEAALRWDGDVEGQLTFDPLVLGWQTDQGTVRWLGLGLRLRLG